MKIEEQSAEIKRLTGEMLDLASKVHPIDFAACMSGLIANIAGQLGPEYWRICCDIKPCSQAGCDCHVLASEFMKVAGKLREDHMRILTKRFEKN